MLSRDDIAILYLDSLGLSYKNMGLTINALGTPSKIFDTKKLDAGIKKLLPSGALERIETLGEDKIEQFVLEDLDRYNVFAITIFSPLYPENLKNIPDPPYVLYTKGDIGVLKERKIGIVGTRMPTNYGRTMAEKFTTEIARSGLVVVSGLSYGIDTCAAVSTLAAGGKTIAVLAGGLDSIYPAQNVDLSKKIADNGLLVSEYRPGVRPRQYSFISRNRIISGLSDGVLVVEAGIKSGASSTAMFCVEQGRELFVLPGNINSPQSAGCNDLINEMPHCFTISPKQVLDRLKVVPAKKEEKPTAQLDLFSQQIIDCLKLEELHFDDICARVGAPSAQVASTLTMLEIMGMVKKLAGNYYTLQ